MTVRRLLLIVVASIVVWAQAWPSTQVLVLVVRSDSPVTDMDSVTVRKLFLGLPVLVNGSPLHPIRNRSDEHFDEIFLQQMVGMTQASYDRQILNGLNRQGWQRPVEATTSAKVLADLYADPQAVTFTWQREVAHDPRLRVVRVLWSD